MSITNAQVAIVGAGLTGYLTAAALAEAGCKNILVFDALPDPTVFDHARPYSQVFYKTGQRILEKIPPLDKEFKKVAYCQHIRVVKKVGPDAKAQITSVTPPAGPLYWILKAHMLEMLDTTIRMLYPGVKFRFGCAVTDVVIPKSNTEKTTLVVKTKDVEERVSADVLLACDGQYSVIRKIMSVHEPEIESKNGMGLYSKASASTGLRVKGLTLSETPVVSAPGQPVEIATPSVIYTFQGKRSGRKTDQVFDMILLPVCAGHSEKRRASMTVKEGHKILKINDVDEMITLFKENFPQLDIDQMILREEMQTFMEATANTFPPVERPMSMTGRFGTAGMAFVGDSAHSFPTDTAQGGNSAFQDVEALFDIVNELKKTDKSWVDVLNEYDEARDAETWALTHLARVGAPYQYGQDKLGELMFSINKNMRKMVGMIIPGGYFSDIDTLVRQDHSYRKVCMLNRVGSLMATALGAALIAAPIILLKKGMKADEEGEFEEEEGNK